MAGETNEACVLAGAVVVELVRLAACTNERFGSASGGRHVGAAFEIGFAAPGAGEHRRGGLDMARFAVVGGASQREFRIAEAVAIGSAALDQRQRLKSLHGGSREDRSLDIADARAPAAGGIDNDDCAPVAAFDDRAAGDFDEDGIRHAVARRRPPSQPDSRATASSSTSSRLEKQKRTKWRGPSAS